MNYSNYYWFQALTKMVSNILVIVELQNVSLSIYEENYQVSSAAANHASLCPSNCTIFADSTITELVKEQVPELQTTIGPREQNT